MFEIAEDGLFCLGTDKLLGQADEMLGANFVRSSIHNQGDDNTPFKFTSDFEK